MIDDYRQVRSCLTTGWSSSNDILEGGVLVAVPTAMILLVLLLTVLVLVTIIIMIIILLLVVLKNNIFCPPNPNLVFFSDLILAGS